MFDSINTQDIRRSVSPTKLRGNLLPTDHDPHEFSDGLMQGLQKRRLIAGAREQSRFHESRPNKPLLVATHIPFASMQEPGKTPTEPTDAV
jgi:hypothetical protein